MSDKFSTIGAQATETNPVPATGEVSKSGECSVSVTNSSGERAQLATLDTANIDIGGNTKYPDQNKTAKTTTVNSSNIFLEGENVVDDTDITSGINNSLRYTKS